MSNSGSNYDLKNNKNEFSKIKVKKGNKKIKKVKSYNKKGIPKKLIKNIHFLTGYQSTSSKEIKNVKREHCNINISEYYKNINNKENFTKKKNGMIKITNNKKIKNYISTDRNRPKLENEKISNGYHHPNTSRNFTYNKIYNNTDKSKGNNNNTINGKD